MEQHASPLLLNSPLEQNQMDENTASECVGKSENDNKVIGELLSFEEVDVIPPSSVRVTGCPIIDPQLGDSASNASQQIASHTVEQSNMGATPVPVTTSSIPTSIKSDFDFRYEFSETRKVLDEFFNKAENEFPVGTVPHDSERSHDASLMKNVDITIANENVGRDKNEGSLNEFNDLNV